MRSQTKQANLRQCFLRLGGGPLSRSDTCVLPHLQDLPKDNMLSIEVRRRAHSDEESACVPIHLSATYEVVLEVLEVLEIADALRDAACCAHAPEDLLGDHCHSLARGRAHCEELVPGPALAIDSRPGLSCFSSKFSSSNFSP